MTLIGADEALDFARLIFPPRWVEERGCVIRGDVFERDNFEQWWAATEGNLTGVEASINHLHLWDVLPNTDEKDYGELWDLGELIVRAWRSSLAEQFPERRFEVTLTDDYGPTVTAFTVREAALPLGKNSGPLPPGESSTPARLRWHHGFRPPRLPEA